MTGAPLRWERREPPLEPVAALALGTAVPALAAATRSRLAAGHRLAVAADGTALLVLGEAPDLPWADGARYLGEDDGVLVPTTARPQPGAALWRVALGAADGQLCVLVPGHALVGDRPAPVRGPADLDRFMEPASGEPGSGEPGSEERAIGEPGIGEPGGGVARSGGERVREQGGPGRWSGTTRSGAEA
ncbi:hypothetical protein ACIQWA_08285 [Kitasatospora sp. NPDC098652]|uniref:bpX5 domain-containing protein n=1 Tax=Kitasatospora sp. NPDC098652 TaxID=3364095 RepID=UPI00380603B4